MSAAFAFLPRKIARSSKLPVINAVAASTTRAPTVPKDTEREPAPIERLQPEVAQKPQYSDEDYSILLCLSLSKYRLWSDPDLRRHIEWSSGANSNDGFFPLSYLLDSRCPLSAADTSESLIVKALRARATHIVDVRMAIPSSNEPGKKRGNFEIRPKFWDDAVYPVTREGWENRTVYVENIPVKHKTLASFCRFILELLPPITTLAGHNRMQGITLPSHHSDDPGTEPKFKSFAVITLADAGDVEFLLATWPWSRRQPRIDDSPDASDAAKFGFRTLPKARWDELNTEYLNYRAKILAEEPVAATFPLPAAPDAPEPSRRPPSPVMTSAASMSYPQGCLVFVRNIHPETNKTTLRNFFAKAVEAKDAIDYVDFNKGMDSCYLRLTTASHAKTLVAHFAQNPTVHANGLDDSGTLSGEDKSVEAQLILGKKEEVYWEKVPEKVCLQAVQKALGLVDDPVESGEGRRRQRKKQKR
ncbi:hypothetical protein C8F04DRAFT_43069 [Mycena alexandri]|uniref:XRRM domain-containing protein n=1 Tax=Mycena alexandri TaxID=1745969 RepID=A0AAD6SN92_9AGAR|nr:hypothetical protein C8F04DRAFT_43069 [Mycena alexandri]